MRDVAAREKVNDQYKSRAGAPDARENALSTPIICKIIQKF